MHTKNSITNTHASQLKRSDDFALPLLAQWRNGSATFARAGYDASASSRVLLDQVLKIMLINNIMIAVASCDLRPLASYHSSCICGLWPQDPPRRWPQAKDELSAKTEDCEAKTTIKNPLPFSPQPFSNDDPHRALSLSIRCPVQQVQGRHCPHCERLLVTYTIIRVKRPK